MDFAKNPLATLHKTNCISTSLSGNCLPTYPAGLLQKNKTHRSLPPPTVMKVRQAKDSNAEIATNGVPRLSSPDGNGGGGKETERGVVVPSFSAQDLVISPLLTTTTTTTTRTVLRLPGREARIPQCLELGLIHIHFDRCLYFRFPPVICHVMSCSESPSFLL